jgi:hypothetical protein
MLKVLDLVKKLDINCLTVNKKTKKVDNKNKKHVQSDVLLHNFASN